MKMRDIIDLLEAPEPMKMLGSNRLKDRIDPRNTAGRLENDVIDAHMGAPDPADPHTFKKGDRVRMKHVSQEQSPSLNMWNRVNRINAARVGTVVGFEGPYVQVTWDGTKGKFAADPVNPARLEFTDDDSRFV